MKLKLSVFAVALLATGSLFASVTEEETIIFSICTAFKAAPLIVNGSITVTGASGNSVEIIAIKKADNQKDLDQIEIEISHSASEIEIETELGKSDSWFSHNNSGEVRYEIIVPGFTELDSVETVNGDVTVSGVSGNVSAESVNGDLDISDLVGDVSLSTVNGSVNAAFAKCEGEQSVKTETVNGRVTISLPESSDVQITADTLNGGINGRDFGLETDKGFVGSDLNGKIGSGSARLNIDTVNGSIKIRSH